MVRKKEKGRKVCDPQRPAFSPVTGRGGRTVVFHNSIEKERGGRVRRIEKMA